MKRLYLTLVVIVLFAYNSFSQIDIIVDFPDSMYTRDILYDVDLPDLILSNTSNESVSCKLKVEYLFNDLYVAENRLSNTPTIQLDAEQSVNMTNYTEDIPLIIMYHDTSFEQSILNSFLDTGKLTICYSVVSSEDTSQLVSSIACSDITIFEPTLGNLSPSNDTLIDYCFSTTLSWNGIQPAPDDFTDLNYSVVVVPIYDGQSDNDAITQNTPVLDTLLRPAVATYNLKLADIEVDSLSDTLIFDTINQIASSILWYTILYDHDGNRIGKNNGVSAIHKLNFRNNTRAVDSIIDSLAIISLIDAENETEDGVADFYDYYKGLILQNQQGQLDPPQYFSYRNLDCPNGGFESQDFNGWEGATGSIKVNWLGKVITIIDKPGLDIGNQHTIMDRYDGNNGYDENIGGQILPIVMVGNYSARLGNWRSGTDVAQLRYKFTVNDDNADFMFNYACVLEDMHKPKERPSFGYQIIDLTTNNTITYDKIIADRSDAFFEKVAGKEIVYRNWTCVPTDLHNYMGHEMEVVFTVTDCAYGAHFGYAYIDGLCESEVSQAESYFSVNSPVCLTTDIIADGSASINETSHYWSIEESDANGNRINPSSEKGKWFVGQTAGVINITDLYTSLGGEWECDQYYRVKLAVNSGCTSWDENVAVVYISPCETADAGSDKEKCVSNPYGLVTIGVSSSNYTSGSTFQWTPTTDLVSPTSSSTLASPATTTSYSLTVTHPNGCPSLPDEVTVFVVNSPHAIITHDNKYCERTLTVTDSLNPDRLGSVYWSPADKTKESIVVSPTSPTTYTVSLTNACGTSSAQIDVPKIYFTGPMSDYIYPKSVLGPDNFLYLADEALLINEYPAYNATALRMEVTARSRGLDQWFIARKQDVSNPIDTLHETGFRNWYFCWAPSDNFSSYQIFLMVVSFKNCTFRDWRDNTFNLGKCLEWQPWYYLIFRRCIDWDPYYKDYSRDAEVEYIR